MANTFREKGFLIPIMCSYLSQSAACFMHSGFLLHIISNYAFQTLCGSPHNIANEEGKINGLPLNRAIYAEPDRGEMLDIIAGTFFICDCSGENFGSLSPEQLRRYTELFKYPEQFFRAGNDIKAVPYIPERSPER